MLEKLSEVLRKATDRIANAVFLDKNLQAFFQILFWVALGMGIIVGGIVGSQILHSGYKKFDEK